EGLRCARKYFRAPEEWRRFAGGAYGETASVMAFGCCRPSSRILPFQHSNRAPGNDGRDSLLVVTVRGAAATRSTSNYPLAGMPSVSRSERSEFPRSELSPCGRRIGSASKRLRETELALRWIRGGARGRRGG